MRAPWSTRAPLLALAATLACLVPACAIIRDDVAPSATIDPAGIRIAQDIRLARDGWPQARWWTRYGDPQLDRLIDYAIDHAPTMAIARSRVDQARAQVDLVRAGSRLQVIATAQVNRQHVSAEGFLGPFALDQPLLGLDGPWYTQGIVGVAGSYDIDIWGAERAAVDASIGVKNARLAEAAAIELELATDVARIYFQRQSIASQLELLQQTREIAEAVLASHEARVERGLDPPTRAAQARAALAQVDQQISMARGQSLQLREILRALVGANADDLPAIDRVALPAARMGMPDTLSYELLSRRPDLQVMRWMVQASLDQVAAARAAFYPKFDIKAFFGFDALHLEDLFESRSNQINLIPGLTLPLFDGGLLNANLRNARTTSNTLVEQYNQAVLDAVRDVAVAGALRQSLDEEEALQHARLRETGFAIEAAQARYRRGLLSRVDAMQARLPLIAQQSELVGIQGRQIAEEIKLVKALGGGFVATTGDAGSAAAQQR